MSEVRPIVVYEEELPIPLEVRRKKTGERKDYSIIPAGKDKLGARLGDPKEILCKKV